MQQVGDPLHRDQWRQFPHILEVKEWEGEEINKGNYPHLSPRLVRPLIVTFSLNTVIPLLYRTKYKFVHNAMGRITQNMVGYRYYTSHYTSHIVYAVSVLNIM